MLRVVAKLVKAVVGVLTFALGFVTFVSVVACVHPASSVVAIRLRLMVRVVVRMCSIVLMLCWCAMIATAGSGWRVFPTCHTGGFRKKGWVGA